jgi:hypothetical protein
MAEITTRIFSPGYNCKIEAVFLILSAVLTEAPPNLKTFIKKFNVKNKQKELAIRYQVSAISYQQSGIGY